MEHVLQSGETWRWQWRKDHEDWSALQHARVLHRLYIPDLLVNLVTMDDCFNLEGKHCFSTSHHLQLVDECVKSARYYELPVPCVCTCWKLTSINSGCGILSSKHFKNYFNKVFKIVICKNLDPRNVSAMCCLKGYVPCSQVHACTCTFAQISLLMSTWWFYLASPPNNPCRPLHHSSWLWSTPCGLTGKSNSVRRIT